MTAVPRARLEILHLGALTYGKLNYRLDAGFPDEFFLLATQPVWRPTKPWLMPGHPN